MDFKVNANMFARVKLNELGVSILKEQHDKLDNLIRERGGEGLGKFKLSLDSEGYYRTQLWMLMWKFGPVMKAGIEQPFDMEIIIENGEPINDDKRDRLEDQLNISRMLRNQVYGTINSQEKHTP